MSKHLPNNKTLRTNAQMLRKQATPWENHLWYDFLKSHPIQFNRQKNIGNYIVHFYCKQASLAVELDGAYHRDEDTFCKDAQRTEELAKLGITVLRFKNSEVDKNFDRVCEKIDGTVKLLIDD